MFALIESQHGILATFTTRKEAVDYLIESGLDDDFSVFIEKVISE